MTVFLDISVELVVTGLAAGGIGSRPAVSAPRTQVVKSFRLENGRLWGRI
jgi:hypothetical protein